jgi:hypothetical protein
MHSPSCTPLHFVSFTSSYQLLSSEVTNYFSMEQLICPIKVFCFLPSPSSKQRTYGIQKDFIGSYSSGPAPSPRLTRGVAFLSIVSYSQTTQNTAFSPQEPGRSRSPSENDRSLSPGNVHPMLVTKICQRCARTAVTDDVKRLLCPDGIVLVLCNWRRLLSPLGAG